MPNNHYCSQHDGIPPLDGQTLPDHQQKIAIWGMKPAHKSCKSVLEGLTIMLRVFINLLYTHTMPNNHYCSTYMTGIPPLDGQTLPDQSAENQDFWSEARNLPTCGCKSMMDGLRIMLGVFINLLYTHTMPNNHYCSTCMMAYTPTWWSKICLISQAENRELRHETCPQVAVKVCWRGLTIMLRVFITLLYTHTMPNNHYCSTCMPYPHLMAKHCLISRQKIEIFSWGKKPAYMWL